ncbi:DUF3467 domain-containing protein [Shewanella algae]|uniref:DUF3467 domain-containing protein n=1 Tax=Shewanella algae TaxID=38313 RepID=UPI0031F5D2A6
MSNDEKNQNEQLIDGVTIFLPDNLKSAVFCNSAFAQFAPEEISVDFVNMGAMSSAVVSRVVMTPSHTKRLIALLSQKVAEYEEMFGAVPEMVEPKAK